MKHPERVPEPLFEEDGHYLGRPADLGDRIIARRLRLVAQWPNFVGSHYHLLEIGCGNGASILDLASSFASIEGLDIHGDHFSEIGAKLHAKGITNCTFRVCNVEEEEPLRQFDRLISFEVIEHLAHENLQYYNRALVDGGLLAVSVPNKWWIFETHGAHLPLLPWNRVPFFSWLPRCLHERYANARIYTRRRIIRLLEDYGFEVMQTAYITAPMDVLPEGRFKRWVIRLFFARDLTRNPFKSTSILVFARKIKSL